MRGAGDQTSLNSGWRLIEHSRASEWWDYKVAPGLAVLYATALIETVSPAFLLLALIQYLIAIAAGATFVGAINDLFDRADDRQAEKFNPASSNPGASWALVAVSCAIGATMLYIFSDRPVAFWTYVAGWVAFAAYSLPPLRFKGRSILGLFCDATGAHLVPAALAVALMWPATRSVGPWFLMVAIWSFSYGLRGIIAHQLADEAADRRSKTPTFVVTHGANVSRWLVQRMVFPAELLALTGMLALISSFAVAAALLLTLAFLCAKTKTFGSRAVLAGQGSNEVIVLADFYILFFPLALITDLAQRDALLGLLAILHLVLFAAYASITGREFTALLRRPAGVR